MTQKALIVNSNGGLYSAVTEEGKIISLKGRGAFRHEKLILLVGDTVEVEKIGENDYFCKTILPRKNELIRPPLANLDVLFIVVSVSSPAPSLLTIDKLISICEYHRIEPVIVVSKSDLGKEDAEKISALYRLCGFSVFETSSEKNDGVEELKTYLKEKGKDEKIFAFSGPSGAGKSSLLNVLFPSLDLEIGSLSEKNARGKNTTRKTELFSLFALLGEEYHGFLADTPGFTFLDFEHFDFFALSDLFDTFREFEKSYGKCQYKKCTHTKEDGCDVIRRVNEGEIPRSRFESYLSLYDTLKKKNPYKK